MKKYQKINCMHSIVFITFKEHEEAVALPKKGTKASRKENTFSDGKCRKKWKVQKESYKVQ